MFCCSPSPGAYRVADSAVANAGGHCRGPRYASGLQGLVGGSSIPGATAHPQLPGAHSSQRAGEAKCQRCPSANVEAAKRGTTSGHTAKIRGWNVCTDKNIIVPSCRKGRMKVMKSWSLSEKRELMVSLCSRCQWLIIPEWFKWTMITSQSGYYILDLTQYGVRLESPQRTSVKSPGCLKACLAPQQVLDYIKEFCLLFREKGTLFFLDVPQRY